MLEREWENFKTTSLSEKNMSTRTSAERSAPSNELILKNLKNSSGQKSRESLEEVFDFDFGYLPEKSKHSNEELISSMTGSKYRKKQSLKYIEEDPNEWRPSDNKSINTVKISEKEISDPLLPSVPNSKSTYTQRHLVYLSHLKPQPTLTPAPHIPHFSNHQNNRESITDRLKKNATPSKKANTPELKPKAKKVEPPTPTQQPTERKVSGQAKNYGSIDSKSSKAAVKGTIIVTEYDTTKKQPAKSPISAVNKAKKKEIAAKFVRKYGELITIIEQSEQLLRVGMEHEKSLAQKFFDQISSKLNA